MLGWRGIRRDLREVDVFKMQLQTFKNLIDDGYTNIASCCPSFNTRTKCKQRKRRSQK